MPIGPEHEGRVYPPTRPYRVSRAKIAEFAAALGDTNPAYQGDSEPPEAPPTFAAVIAAQAWGALFDDPDLGLALQRVVHAEQRFDVVRPMREDDDVVATLGITRVRNRGTTDMVTIAVKLDDPAGEPYGTATSMLIHNHPEGQE
ncbi:MaoC family dehydratase N-terminal domain-containing protein [Propionibacterium sp.]|uniref:FAS1-like dehydratase domain-containing protein n=1 Tax=Propionibacterium sp. TaxID=1977903 RepID=UPI0039E88F34